MKSLLQRTFVIGVVVSVLAGAAHGQQQLISNGGFETGFTG